MSQTQLHESFEVNDATGELDSASAAAVAEFDELLAYREAEEIIAEGVDLEPIVGGRDVNRADTEVRISEAGFELIVNFETGGRRYYERVLGAKPIWPRYRSGITIGFGYDVGYVREAEFHRDWAELGEEALARFTNTIARHGGNTSASDLKDMARQLSDIPIPWEMADRVFRARTVPKFIRLTDRALPNTDMLNGDCFGALVSLTFNRGPSFGRSGDRYREMRQIKAALATQRFLRTPDILRAMSRVWHGTSVYRGLKRRRYAEARLFESGLATTSVAMLATDPDFEPAPAATPESESGNFLGTASSLDATPEVKDLWNGPSDEDFWVDQTEEDILESASREMTGAELARAAAGSRIKWGPDNRTFDYAHIKRQFPSNLRFSFVGADLEMLCRLNNFPIDELENTPVLFGLRGCAIIGGDASEDGELRSELVLKDQRPDHRNARCVLGVWDRQAGTVAVFPGSTVPNEKAVRGWYATKRSGNILPTGMYRYICGMHNGRPGCFLLRKTVANKRVVIVRRSSDDLMYEDTDYVHRCAPGDNIHPTFSMSHGWFSSFGCQVVVGKADKGYSNHRGPWARFRKAAGLTDDNGEPNKPYLYVMLTGLEALIASDLRRKDLAIDPIATAPLQRLRFGSSGEPVKWLQERLGAGLVDGDFGSETATLLHKKQQAFANGSSDGVYTPDLDRALGWGIFGFIGV